MKKGDEESMSECIARADIIKEIFSNNNVSYDDIFLIRAVKDGLPKEYEVLVDVLDTRKDVDYESLKSALKNKENQIKSRNNPCDSVMKANAVHAEASSRTATLGLRSPKTSRILL